MAEQKMQQLQRRLSDMGRVFVAFSGGVDSTFLLKAAHDTLGKNAVALTCHTVAIPPSELEAARKFCEQENIRQISFDLDVLQIPQFSGNAADRCYHCKYAIFRRMTEIVAEQGGGTLLDGSNLDDAQDYRPGMQALRELGVISPLQEIGFTKDDIRRMSAELRLPTWDKPALACLASRICFGEPIDEVKLTRIARAEAYLFSLGFKQVRVRLHNDLARIELLPNELSRFFDNELYNQVYNELKKLGFAFVTLDLGGFSSGSMNRTIRND